LPQGPNLYIANPDVTWSEEGSEALLFNPDRDQCMVLNTTGRMIWRYLSSPRTKADMVAVIMDKCSDVRQGQAVQDVDEFIEKMAAMAVVGIYKGDVD
jgi:hypothetical protein